MKNEKKESIPALRQRPALRLSERKSGRSKNQRWALSKIRYRSKAAVLFKSY
jgi:hypothetical protein